MATNADLITAIAAANWQTAHNLALELAAAAADGVDKSVGDLSLSLSQKHKSYLAIAQQMKEKLAATAVPYAGGISAADKASRAAGSDRVQPAFTRDLHDYVADVNRD